MMSPWRHRPSRQTRAPGQIGSITNWKRRGAITATPESLRPWRRQILRRRHLRRWRDDSGPDIAGTEELAERTGFDPQRIRARHGHGRVIGVAAVAAKDVAGPNRGSLLRRRLVRYSLIRCSLIRCSLGLHVDQQRLARGLRRGVEDIAAQRVAARLDANRSLFAFGLPVAERGRRIILMGNFHGGWCGGRGGGPRALPLGRGRRA